MDLQLKTNFQVVPKFRNWCNVMDAANTIVILYSPQRWISFWLSNIAVHDTHRHTYRWDWAWWSQRRESKKKEGKRNEWAYLRASAKLGSTIRGWGPFSRAQWCHQLASSRIQTNDPLSHAAPKRKPPWALLLLKCSHLYRPAISHQSDLTGSAAANSPKFVS